MAIPGEPYKLEMNIPAIVFGIVLSTLYGAGYHLWRGGDPGRLLICLLLGWAGFVIGQALASLWGWNFDLFGEIHLVIASVSSLLSLLAGNWLIFRSSAIRTD